MGKVRYEFHPLQVIQVVDEQERVKEIVFRYHQLDEPQRNSHGYSYIKAREIYQAMSGNEPFGLECKLEDE